MLTRREAIQRISLVPLVGMIPALPAMADGVDYDKIWRDTGEIFDRLKRNEWEILNVSADRLAVRDDGDYWFDYPEQNMRYRMRSYKDISVVLDDLEDKDAELQDSLQACSLDMMVSSASKRAKVREYLKYRVTMLAETIVIFCIERDLVFYYPLEKDLKRVSNTPISSCMFINWSDKDIQSYKEKL